MTLAIFDLDDTLIDCDSSNLWLRYLVTQGRADEGILAIEHAMLQAYHRPDFSMSDYFDLTLQPLAGVAVDEVGRWADDYVSSTIPALIFPAARRQIDWHRKQGDKLLIISATADFIVRRIATLLGVDEVIAVNLEKNAGRYTGATEGVVSFREGKVERLNEWLPCQGQSLLGSHGYSDSVNDLPLLHAVQHASVINPSTLLKQAADEHQWRQFSWHLDHDSQNLTGSDGGDRVEPQCI